MGGGGSISSMNSTLKNNRIPKRNTREKYKEYYINGVNQGQPLKYKNKLSDTEMHELRKKLVAEKRKQLRRIVFIYIICFTLVSIAVILAIVGVNGPIL